MTGLWLLTPSQLSEYQEQAYLLDPFLEQLVLPVVSKFKDCIQNETLVNDASGGYGTRTGGLSNLLYNYVKFRGYKTISQSQTHIFRQSGLQNV